MSEILSKYATPFEDGPPESIGRNIPGNSVFNGMIDEAQFYNTALSHAQIAAITPVPEPATLAALALGGLALLRRQKR